jgi:hypothetical protein
VLALNLVVRLGFFDGDDLVHALLSSHGDVVDVHLDGNGSGCGSDGESGNRSEDSAGSGRNRYVRVSNS